MDCVREGLTTLKFLVCMGTDTDFVLSSTMSSGEKRIRNWQVETVKTRKNGRRGRGKGRGWRGGEEAILASPNQDTNKSQR